MFPLIWDFLKVPYYEFIVVKEPELIIQWREYHAANEKTKLRRVYPSKVNKASAFHVLKSHIPYKQGMKSIIFYGTENALPRTSSIQYYPLEDYDTLIQVHDDPVEVPVLDKEGKPKIDPKTNQPMTELYYPVRHAALASDWLQDSSESQADHRVQAEPPDKNAWIKEVAYVVIAAFILIYLASLATGHPIFGK